MTRHRRCRPAVAGAGPSGGCRARSSVPDGHQITGPINANNAGMTSVRTTNVSSRIPRPTISPTCVSTISGRTPSTQNTAANTMPALVITPPVADTARTIPSPVPCSAVSSRARVTKKIV